MLSFEDLYRLHAPSVFRFAHYLSGSRADAEDITSETFVRAFSSDTEIRSPTVKAYLFTIARNLFLHERRKSARLDSLDETLAAENQDPARTAEQRDELRKVIARLQILPEIDRAALLMRTLDAMSYEEIAQTLGLSLSN